MEADIEGRSMLFVLMSQRACTCRLLGMLECQGILEKLRLRELVRPRDELVQLRLVKERLCLHWDPGRARRFSFDTHLLSISKQIDQLNCLEQHCKLASCRASNALLSSPQPLTPRNVRSPDPMHHSTVAR